MSASTDHMDIRIPASEVRVGDLLVTVGKNRIDSTVTEIRQLPVGHRVYGPRGGAYRLNVPMISLETRCGAPVVTSTRTVTVYRAVQA